MLVDSNPNSLWPPRRKQSRKNYNPFDILLVVSYTDSLRPTIERIWEIQIIVLTKKHHIGAILHSLTSISSMRQIVVRRLLKESPLMGVHPSPLILFRGRFRTTPTRLELIRMFSPYTTWKPLAFLDYDTSPTFKIN